MEVFNKNFKRMGGEGIVLRYYIQFQECVGEMG